MESKRKEVSINIELVTNSTKPGFVDFIPSSKVRVPDTSKRMHKFKFKNSGHPGFLIHFNLIDPAGLGWEFPATPARDDPKDAMWVKPIQSEDDPCPDSEVHWDGFKALSVEPYNSRPNSKLIVENPNTDEQLFAFTLRLTNDGGKTFVPYDPIGEDQNGPRKSAFLSIAMPLFGLAAVGLLAYGAYRAFAGA